MYYTPKENLAAFNRFVTAARADLAEVERISRTHRDAAVAAAVAPIMARARSRYAELMERLEASAATEAEQVVTTTPSYVQRFVVMHTPGAPERCAAIMSMLRDASLNELQETAAQAVKEKDSVAAHALRMVCAGHSSLKPEDAASIAAALNSIHEPTHQKAIDDLVATQYLVYMAERGGPLASSEYLMQDPQATMTAYRRSCSYVDASGKTVLLADANAMQARIRAGVTDPATALGLASDPQRHAQQMAGLSAA